ncbi:EAL domain-containing protein [Duganella sp. LX20W]|uniref:EAL domain-containing protein n=1 Tax=Rugamonas brunnea TaxID=2758569 RepID=A0A7W2EV35_9BURK|nr:EAL domain-containing protein [Rugamonas brunnea]MBA5639157.1 EAL domain-containing protein [Rugamonas brunnea]
MRSLDLFNALRPHPMYGKAMTRMARLLLVLALVQWLAWLAPARPGTQPFPNYLPLHMLMETASIIVSIMVFIVGWNARGAARSGNVVGLACCFLAVGAFDFLHMVSYVGMPDLVSANDAQKHLNFWLAARVLAAGGLLAAAVRRWRPFAADATRYWLLGATVAGVLALAWVVLWHQDWLPDTFIPGHGLTALKKNTEYLVIAINLATAVLLLARIRRPQPFKAVLLFGAVMTMAMGEFFFTLYTTMTGSYNVLGHLYKTISYLFIYRAVVVEAIDMPYNALAQLQERLTFSLQASNTGLWDWDLASDEIYLSPEWKAQLGYGPDALSNSLATWDALLHPQDREAAWQTVRDYLASGRLQYENAFRMRHADGGYRWILARGERHKDGDGNAHLLGSHVDITAQKQTEQALRAESEKNLALLRNASDGIHILDAHGDVIEASVAFCAMLGYTREELIGMNVARWDARFGQAELDALLARQLDGGVHNQFETRHRRKDGSLVDVEISNCPLELAGQPVLFNSARDITERKRVEAQLRITASVFENSQEGILITDDENDIVDVNAAFTRITGYARDEVVGRNPRMLSSGRHDGGFYQQLWAQLQRDGYWRGELWDRRKSGEVYPELVSISAVRDERGQVQRYVAVFSDISQIKAHEDELNRAAHYDGLTGVPNRVLLADRMKQAIARTAREGNIMAVCYLDLDGFKHINDSLGHDVGDQVLIEAARRIGASVRADDTVARLGGDEFVVLLLGLHQAGEWELTLRRLLEAIAQPFTIGDKTVTLSASAGVAVYPLDQEDPDTLLRHADQAMYLAKQSGKNRYHLYDTALDRQARDQLEFLASIRHGLEQGQFELYYQPKVNLRTRAVVGAEALIRWHHPQRGLLAPGAFLAQVANTELDIQIGEWVAATALAQLRTWHEQGLKLSVSINISGYHLESPDFVDRLRKLMAPYPMLPFGALQIEVLETVALNDIAIVRDILAACGRLGVTFALDDFGTGYSSLSYLSSLPFDELKIDQSFVRDMLDDKGDLAIVQGVVALAAAFERQIVAEGIETPAHYQALLDMGCALGQGYGIAKPMPAGALPDWRGQWLEREVAA